MSQVSATAQTAAQASDNVKQEEKLGPGAYVALFFAMCIFSGVFYKMPEAWKWLGALDFTTLIGSFGKIANAGVFNGTGGHGARDGFLFALTLFPGVMLALGLLEVLSYYGALKAAQKLLTPLLRPILDVPGSTGLALITDLQSTDAGAALTKGLYDRGGITKKELVIIAAWQYAGAGMISNYYSTVSGLFSWFLIPDWIPVDINYCMKFVAGIFCRFVLNTVYKKDFNNGN